MTPEQENTVRNLKLDPADATEHLDHLIFPWTPGAFIIVNPHGSAASYPDIMRDHALLGIQ